MIREIIESQNKVIYHGTPTKNISSIRREGFRYSRKNVLRNLNYSENRFYFFYRKSRTEAMIAQFILDRDKSYDPSIKLIDTYTESPDNMEEIEGISSTIRDWKYFEIEDRKQIIKKFNNVKETDYSIIELDFKLMEKEAVFDKVNGVDFGDGLFITQRNSENISAKYILKIEKFNYKKFIKDTFKLNAK